MKVLYIEGLANHIGPESCIGVRKGEGEALTGERAGWVLSREINAPPRGGLLRGADAVEIGRKATLGTSPWQDVLGPCAVKDPTHVRTHFAREPGDPIGLCDRKICQSVSGSRKTGADDER